MMEQFALYKNIAGCCVEEGNLTSAEAYYHRFEGAAEMLYAMGLLSEEDGAQLLGGFWK